MSNEAGAEPGVAAPWHIGLAACPRVFGATSDFHMPECTVLLRQQHPIISSPFLNMFCVHRKAREFKVFAC